MANPASGLAHQSRHLALARCVPAARTRRSALGMAFTLALTPLLPASSVREPREQALTSSTTVLGLGLLGTMVGAVLAVTGALPSLTRLSSALTPSVAPGFRYCCQRRNKLSEALGVRCPVERQQAAPVKGPRRHPRAIRRSRSVKRDKPAPGAQMLPRLPGVSSAGSPPFPLSRSAMTGRGLRWGGFRWRWTNLRPHASLGSSAEPFIS
jgi:hypothetical protein